MTASIDELGAEVKALRSHLLENGFVIANGPGELKYHPMWVSTGYAHREYVIGFWLRPTGAGNPVDRRRIRLTTENLVKGIGVQIADALIEWCQASDVEQANTYPPVMPEGVTATEDPY